MFVPLHRRGTRQDGQKPVRPATAAAVLSAVIGGFVAVAARSLVGPKSLGANGYIVLGIVLAVVAVACGIAIARSIGGQGKV